MGTRSELEHLARFLLANRVRPVIAETLPLSQARRGFEMSMQGNAFGKIVLRP
jgi:NADPH:quinone reductase-like Zn-dependent oxidoreductase